MELKNQAVAQELNNLSNTGLGNTGRYSVVTRGANGGNVRTGKGWDAWIFDNATGRMATKIPGDMGRDIDTAIEKANSMARYWNNNGRFGSGTTKNISGGNYHGGTVPNVNTPNGTMSNAGQSLYDRAANRLTDTYNKNIQSTVNNLNRRGLFSSSIANEDIADVNKNLGLSLADLASNIAGQEAGFNTQNVQNYATLQNLGLQQQQMALLQQKAERDKMNSLLGLFG